MRVVAAGVDMDYEMMAGPPSRIADGQYCRGQQAASAAGWMSADGAGSERVWVRGKLVA